MATPPATGFPQVLERMYERHGLDSLADHIENTHGIAVAKMSQLDIGVFRVDRSDKGPPLVARLFSGARPHGAALADLSVLRHLADIGFPAERPCVQTGVSSRQGQALLLTQFVRSAPKGKRPPYPIVKLGAMIGRLHTLAVPGGADRPAGALHHFAEGTMTDELRAAVGWLDSAAELDGLREALLVADGGDGLPEAFVHPDPVPKNVIFTADGPVLIDWTSAGRGPRLASMTLMLRSGWAAVPFMKGYTKVVRLTGEEWDRLPALLFGRQLVGLAFRVCRDPATPVPSSKELSALRRRCEAKAAKLSNALGVELSRATGH